MLKKYLLKQDELVDYEAGDLNKDGKINVFDFMILKRILLK